MEFDIKVYSEVINGIMFNYKGWQKAQSSNSPLIYDYLKENITVSDKIYDRVDSGEIANKLTDILGFKVTNYDVVKAFAMLGIKGELTGWAYGSHKHLFLDCYYYFPITRESNRKMQVDRCMAKGVTPNLYKSKNNKKSL